MKIARKTLAVSLAVMLVLSLVLNVSAAYDWVEYGGEQYSLTLNCSSGGAFGKTETTSLTAEVGVLAVIYDSSGKRLASGSLENQPLSAAVQVNVVSPNVAASAYSEHYSDGVIIRSMTQRAS